MHADRALHRGIFHLGQELGEVVDPRVGAARLEDFAGADDRGDAKNDPAAVGATGSDGTRMCEFRFPLCLGTPWERAGVRGAVES